VGKKTRDEKWQELPKWKQQAEKVLRLAQSGMSDEQIADLVQLKTFEVKRLVEDDHFGKSKAIENYKNKIPLMRNCVGLGLESLQAVLLEMLDPNYRAKMLQKMSDVDALKNVVKDINVLLRLEENKSTVNIASAQSYQKTRAVIEMLRKEDPIFDYPELPEQNPLEELTPMEPSLNELIDAKVSEKEELKKQEIA
jgi:hypothetical protein